MKTTYRYSAIILVPCLLLVLGMFGTACSKQSDADLAAYQAAYLSAIYSITATNASLGTVTVTTTVPVTATATDSSVSVITVTN